MSLFKLAHISSLTVILLSHLLGVMVWLFHLHCEQVQVHVTNDNELKISSFENNSVQIFLTTV